MERGLLAMESRECTQSDWLNLVSVLCRPAKCFCVPGVPASAEGPRQVLGLAMLVEDGTTDTPQSAKELRTGSICEEFFLGPNFSESAFENLEDECNRDGLVQRPLVHRTADVRRGGS